MMSSFHKSWFLTIAAVLVFASATFAQTTSMTLTGTGNNTVEWGTGFGVYVDPYTATVGGVPNTPVICDDWSNNSFVGESWTANVTNLTAVSSGSPMFGNNAAGQTLYNEVAWLATNLLANYSSSPSAAQTAAQIADSFAIWQLTYGANGTPVDPTAPTTTYFPSLDQAAVTAAETNAANAVAGGWVGSGWQILTPNTSDPVTCSGSGCPSPNNAATLGVPQEFLVYTPEASTMVMFGAGLLGLLAMAFFFRRNAFQPAN